MNINFKRLYVLYISGLLMVIAIILLIFPGLPLGIDFTSGSTISYRWVDKNPTQEDIIYALKDIKVTNLPKIIDEISFCAS